MARLSADSTKIVDNYDRITGVPFNATKVTTWWDGSVMNDGKVDNYIYFKNKPELGGGYAKRDYDGAFMLQKDTMADMRALSSYEKALLLTRVVKGIQLNGYYANGDKAPLLYTYKTGSFTDNSGGTIVISGMAGGLIADFGGKVHFKDFGTVNSLSIDDATPIANAVTHCRASGDSLILPSTNVLYSASDMNFTLIRNLRLEGRVDLAVTKIILVGSSSSTTTPDNAYINQVTGSGYIRVQGAKNLNIRINRAETFELWADGSISTIASIAYCRVDVGYIPNLRIVGQNGGWINSNFFHVQRSRNLYIKSLDNSYTHNSNIFYNPTFENSTIDIDNASTNMFYDCRFEGDNMINFRSRAWANRFYTSWKSIPQGTWWNTIRSSAVDEGRDNQVIPFTYKDLQIEYIYTINAKSNNYNIDTVTLNNDDSFTSKSNNIYDSGLIMANDILGIEVLCDAEILRGYVQFYDSDRNLITTEYVDRTFSSSNMSWDVSTSTYRNTTNRDTVTFAIVPTKPVDWKYFRFRINTLVNGTNFRYIKIILKRNKRSEIIIPGVPNNLTSNIFPTSANYPENTHIQNTGIGTNYGWVYKSSVWVPFGIASADAFAVKSGTTAQRPTVTTVGYQYFDTTLGTPIWLESVGAWVDATGATV